MYVNLHFVAALSPLGNHYCHQLATLSASPDPFPYCGGNMPPYELLARSDKKGSRVKHLICNLRDSTLPSSTTKEKQKRFLTLSKNFVEFMQYSSRVQAGQGISIIVV